MKVIKIPLRCVNCGYPNQYGSRIEAEIKYSSRDKIIQKKWTCPECNAEKVIEFHPRVFKNNPLKALFAISGEKKEKKDYETMTPGFVESLE